MTLSLISQLYDKDLPSIWNWCSPSGGMLYNRNTTEIRDHLHLFSSWQPTSRRVRNSKSSVWQPVVGHQTQSQSGIIKDSQHSSGIARTSWEGLVHQARGDRKELK